MVSLHVSHRILTEPRDFVSRGSMPNVKQPLPAHTSREVSKVSTGTLKPHVGGGTMMEKIMGIWKGGRDDTGEDERDSNRLVRHY